MRTWSRSAVDVALEEQEKNPGHKGEEKCCNVTISCSDLSSKDSEEDNNDEDDDCSFLLVDQILGDRGLSLQNVSLLAVGHKGLMLCPIQGTSRCSSLCVLR